MWFQLLTETAITFLSAKKAYAESIPNSLNMPHIYEVPVLLFVSMLFLSCPPGAMSSRVNFMAESIGRRILAKPTVGELNYPETKPTETLTPRSRTFRQHCIDAEERRIKCNRTACKAMQRLGVCDSYPRTSTCSV